MYAIFVVVICFGVVVFVVARKSVRFFGTVSNYIVEKKWHSTILSWPRFELAAPSRYARLAQRLWGSKRKLLEQLPDALDRLSDSLRAGFSLPQAIAFVSGELPRPIDGVFSMINRGYTLGLSSETLFQSLTTCLDDPAWYTVAEICKAGERLGGNAVQLFTTQAKVLRAEREAERELASLTAAGRTSGYIVALLAPVVVIFLWLMSPDYISVLFTTLLGKVLFGLSMALEIVGFWWIARIVRV